MEACVSEPGLVRLVVSESATGPPTSPTQHLYSSMEAPTADGPDPSGRWACEFCPESFARKEHLQRHEFSHLGLKPFRCDVCSRMFSRRFVSSSYS